MAIDINLLHVFYAYAHVLSARLAVALKLKDLALQETDPPKGRS
jgi:hypothetical protein